jgi:hypothetical protein
MAHTAIGVLDGEVGAVADHYQTFLRRLFLGAGQCKLGALVEAPAAALLDLSDAFDLALGEPPPRHDQGLKW